MNDDADFEVEVITLHAMWPSSNDEHMAICTMNYAPEFGRAFTLWNETTSVSILRWYNVRQRLPVWPGNRVATSFVTTS